MTLLPKLSLVLLACGALLGNYLSLPLFYGVDLLFGGIFVFLTLLLHGKNCAIAVALLSSSYTYHLWGHPYAIIIFTLEAIWVSGLKERFDTDELPLLDISYWLLAGVPLISLCYGVILDLDWVSTGVIILKQPINSILNALIAAQIFYSLPSSYLNQLNSKNDRAVNIRQISSNLFITLVLVASIGFTIWDGYSIKDRVEANLNHNLNNLREVLNHQTQLWITHHQAILQRLAERPAQTPAELDVLRDINSHWTRIYIANAEGEISQSSPPIEEDERFSKDLNLSQTLIFQGLQRYQTQTISKITERDTLPMLKSGVAIRSDDTFAGVVYGELELMPLQQQFQEILKDWGSFSENSNWVGLRFLVCDEQNNLIFSNQSELNFGEVVNDDFGSRKMISPQLSQTIEFSNTSTIQAWEESTYIYRYPLGSELRWQLQLELPAVETLVIVRRSYFNHLLVVFGVMVVSFSTAPLVSSWLTTPLQKIAKQTTDLPQKLNQHKAITFPHSRIREIQALAENSDLMVQQLQTQFHEVETHKDHLAQEVQARTLELEQALSVLSAELVQREKTTKQLIESERRLRNLIENTSLGIAMANAQGKILFVNPAFTQLLGYSAEEVLKFHFSEMVHPEDFAREKPLFEELVAKQRDSYQLEERFLTEAGREIWASLTVSANYDEEGNFLCAVAMFEDISAKKSYEAGLEQANLELERANRLKDEFLATMSHELRTPLNAILGMTEGLQEQVYGSLNTKQLQCLNIVQQSGNHLLALINDILDLSKIEAEKLELNAEEIALPTFCEKVISFVGESAYQKQIRLNFEISHHLQMIIGDERRLRQMLLNLLSNAIKFTSEGGQVTLKVDLVNTGADLAFSVIDTGIGIAEEDFSKLYQPFTQIDGQLNRQVGGTGLGLSLVKRIADLHEGTVSVQSTVGKGSCFTVTIPYRKGKTPNQPVLNGDSTTSRATLKLLIADHDPASLLTISSYLKARGYQVINTEQGESAIALIYQEQPDVILIELEMPDHNSLDVIRQLRAEPSTRNIPIIAFTSLPTPKNEADSLQAGANYYLTKPMRLRELLDTIQTLNQP